MIVSVSLCINMDMVLKCKLGHLVPLSCSFVFVFCSEHTASPWRKKITANQIARNKNVKKIAFGNKEHTPD